MGMNCYDLGLSIEVCISGAGTLTVFVNDSDVTNSGQVGSAIANWDGGPTTFNGFVNNNQTGCTIVSSSITVTAIDNNGDNVADQVRVTVSVVVDDCDSSYTIYDNCGGDGPHEFNETQVLDLSGAPCTNGAVFGP